MEGLACLLGRDMDLGRIYVSIIPALSAWKGGWSLDSFSFCSSWVVLLLLLLLLIHTTTNTTTNTPTPTTYFSLAKVILKVSLSPPPSLLHPG